MSGPDKRTREHSSTKAAAAARLDAAELVAECQAADLQAVKRRLFQLDQQVGALAKSTEHAESRVSRLQLVLILAFTLVIGGYCVLHVYGVTGLLIGAAASAGVGALIFFDEGK